MNHLDAIRSGTTPPPPMLTAAVDMVCTLVQPAGERTGSATHSRGDSSEPALAMPDGADQLIAILGKRGSGKSTLLAAVCSATRRKCGAIVLPTVRPDVFAATDSMLLAVLLTVEALSFDILTTAPREDDAEGNLSFALSEALRAASVSSGGAYYALTASRESAGQYGVDAVSIVRHRLRTGASVNRLFQALRVATNKPLAPIVVPIDDADLSPANVGSVLSAVRLLGSLPAVYPIICASRDQLQLTVNADVKQQYSSNISDGAAYTLATEIVSKLLRAERCVSPPTIARSDRASFTPIGHNKTLYQTLAGPNLASGNRLAQLIWVDQQDHSRLQPTEINQWLPETPRGLEQVCNATALLYTIAQTSGDQVTAYQTLVNLILPSVPGLDVQIEQAQQPTSKARRTSSEILFRWPNLTIGIAARGRFRQAATDPNLRFAVRYLNNVTASVYLPTETGDEDTRVRLAPSAVSAVEAIQELSISGLIGAPAGLGTAYLGERDFEFLQAVSILGQATDDRFMAMPDSIGVQAIARSTLAWNRLVDFASEANRVRSAKGAASLVRRYLHLVGAFWLDGSVRALNSTRPPKLEHLIGDLCAKYLRYVDTQSHMESYSLARAFTNWFEIRLPNVFHSILLGPDQTRAACSAWIAALSAGPRAVEATSELREAFESRLAKQIDEERRKKSGSNAWIFGYDMISDVIGTEFHADVLMFGEEFRSRRRSRSMGTDILGGSVELAESGAYKYAPHQTREGDEELKVLREVLEQYRLR